MHWTEYKGAYPPGYVVEQGLQPTFHEQQPATWHWARRHGPAIIHYSRELAVGVDGALLSDGGRGRAEAPLHTANSWRRPLNDVGQAWRGEPARVPIAWQWGTLHVTGDDVVFLDGPQPEPELEDDSASILKRELYESAELRAVVSSFDEARILFAFAVNFEFIRAADGLQQRFSSNGDAAQFVADVRRLGEYWADFKWSDLADLEDRSASERRVEEVLVSLGWRGSFERQARLAELEAVKTRLRSQFPHLDAADGFVSIGHDPDTGKGYMVVSPPEHKPKR